MASKQQKMIEASKLLYSNKQASIIQFLRLSCLRYYQVELSLLELFFCTSKGPLPCR